MLRTALMAQESLVQESLEGLWFRGLNILHQVFSTLYTFKGYESGKMSSGPSVLKLKAKNVSDKLDC